MSEYLGREDGLVLGKSSLVEMLMIGKWSTYELMGAVYLVKVNFRDQAERGGYVMEVACTQVTSFLRHL